MGKPIPRKCLQELKHIQSGKIRGVSDLYRYDRFIAEVLVTEEIWADLGEEKFKMLDRDTLRGMVLHRVRVLRETLRSIQANLR